MKYKKRALTLLEALLVLGVAAFVINAAITLANETENKEKAAITQQEIAQIFGIVSNNEDEIPIPNANTPIIVIQSNQIISSGGFSPQELNGNAISDIWGGPITTSILAIPNSSPLISEEMGNIPQSPCVAIVTKNYPNLFGVSGIGGISTIQTLNGVNLSLTQAEKICNSQYNNTIIVFFYY